MCGIEWGKHAYIVCFFMCVTEWGMHVFIVCFWRCEYAGFCVEDFMFHNNFHSLIQVSYVTLSHKTSLMSQLSNSPRYWNSQWGSIWVIKCFRVAQLRYLYPRSSNSFIKFYSCRTWACRTSLSRLLPRKSREVYLTLSTQNDTKSLRAFPPSGCHNALQPEIATASIILLLKSSFKYQSYQQVLEFAKLCISQNTLRPMTDFVGEGRMCVYKLNDAL